MLIHHGRSPFATVPKRQKPRENGGNGTAAIKVQPNQGPGGCNGMGSNANSTARNDKEGSYVENEALVGRGAEGETTAEMDAPQKHEHRRRGRKRARHLRGRRHGHLLLRHRNSEVSRRPGPAVFATSVNRLYPASSKGPEKMVSPAHSTSL